MSERPDAEDGLEDDGPEVEADDETPDAEDEGGEGEDEGEDDAPAAARKKQEDWEKRAHNHAGQAARERSRRRAAERKAADLEARLDRIERDRGGSRQDEDDLLAVIGQLRDDDEDPVGDIASVKRALKLFRDRQLAEEGESAQHQALVRQIETLKSAMAESEEDFTLDHADYGDAAKFYRQARTDELNDAGYTGAHLQRKLADDLFGVVRMALESGQDPAERVYALAKRRGWKSGMKAADRKLDTLQRASDTGARVRSAPANGVLSWGDVAKLDGAARDKAFAKLRERETARRRH